MSFFIILMFTISDGKLIKIETKAKITVITSYADIRHHFLKIYRKLNLNRPFSLCADYIINV